MNIIEWRNTLCQDESVSPRGKHIGLTLSLFYRENKRTYPTIDTLCDWTSSTSNTVSSAIKDLIKAKYLTKKPFRFPNARFSATEYIFEGVTDYEIKEKEALPAKFEPPIEVAFEPAIEPPIEPSKFEDKIEEIEEESKKNNIDAKNIDVADLYTALAEKKKPVRASVPEIELPYITLPDEWKDFCKLEMRWDKEQAYSAFTNFRDYWTSPARGAKNKKKDWFMTFKTTSRSGITKPNANIVPKKKHEREDGMALIMENLYGTR